MAVNNSLVQSQKKEVFSTFLTKDSVKSMINNTLGGKDGQRFMAAILSAVSANPALAECEHSSILSAALLGEGLKLSPSPQLGQYYMVPYNDRKKGYKVAQFQIGYKGLLQLAIRSGYYKKINVLAIKEGELNNFDPLNEIIDCMIIDDEEAREAAPTVGYYVMFEYLNGFRKVMYWSLKKMEVHADKYSQAFKLAEYRKLQTGQIPKADLWKYSSFWYKDFDAMALKTMIRQIISKWGIMSIELQRAFENDIEVVDAKTEYTDNCVTLEQVKDDFFDGGPEIVQGMNETAATTLFDGDPGPTE